ncbi:MAG: aldehyde dehydrogenase family protein [Methanobacteriota archaeon]
MQTRAEANGDKMFVDGKWIDRDEKMDVRDPFDGSLIDRVPKATIEDVELALKSAVEGFRAIRGLPAHQRAEILMRTSNIVKRDFDEFARTIAREGSKTIKEARREVTRCINTLTVSAEESKRILGETIPFDSYPGGENKIGYYYRFPIGVILAITPFNDPLNLVAHKLGPAFASGNSVILKPTTATPLSSVKLVRAFLEAQLPPKAIQLLIGSGKEIGEPLVQDDRVRMVSFTGGFDAGKRITQLAGIKKIGMELGSNSPVIVCEDANLEYAIESCVSGAFSAAGQNCIGVQRIYVHKDVYAKFKDGFVERTKKYKVGDKLKEDTDMGPMINETEAKRIEEWVNEAREFGAIVLSGGGRSGSIYSPTILENVPEKARIHREEAFGPVVNLYPTSSIDEAIAKANSLPYGLLAAIFTSDMNTAMKAAHELECGGVMINESTDYRLDSMPFGGIKWSGLGREGIKFAIHEMTEPKVVCFNRI